MDIKDLITARASELFSKNGIRGVTMNDVSETAGISKRTLYEHFSNKEALLTSCLRYEHSRSLELRTSIEEEARNIIDIIHRHFRHAVILIQEMHPGYLTELQKLHPEVWKKEVEPLLHERDLYVVELVKRGIDQGVFRKNTDPHIVAKLLHAQVDLLADTRVFPLDRFLRADVFRHIIMVFVRGIATSRGLQEIDALFSDQEKE